MYGVADAFVGYVTLSTIFCLGLSALIMAMLVHYKDWCTNIQIYRNVIFLHTFLIPTVFGAYASIAGDFAETKNPIPGNRSP